MRAGKQRRLEGLGLDKPGALQGPESEAPWVDKQRLMERQLRRGQDPRMAAPMDEYGGESPDRPTFDFPDEPGDYNTIMRGMMQQPRMWPSQPQGPFDQGPAGDESMGAFRALRRGGRNQGGGFRSY